MHIFFVVSLNTQIWKVEFIIIRIAKQVEDVNVVDIRMGINLVVGGCKILLQRRWSFEMKKKIITVVLILVILIVTIAVTQYKNIQAYYTHQAEKINKFSVGEIGVELEEPKYEDNQIVTPNQEITKDPTLSNTGKVDAYLRAQVYVPISNEIKYVDEHEQVVTPTTDIELVTYELNEGWVEVNGEDEKGFSGEYIDSYGNRYQVHTYKYTENGEEKIIKPGEEIENPVFDKVKIINYLDMDKTINIKLHVTALAMQLEGGTAKELWSYFINQNETGIVGVN